jgi:hypothetical protein
MSFANSVVAETMIRNQQLQAVPTAVAIGVQQTIGLGIVLKSSLLKELFEAATAKFKSADPTTTAPEPLKAP